MFRLAFPILTLVLFAGSAHAQLPTLLDPNPPCFLCVDSPPAGTFSERHYQRQQRTYQRQQQQPTWQDYVEPPTYTPPSNRHSLSDQAPQYVPGSMYMWPTPELQMQSERLELEQWKAGQRGCNSWTLEGC